MQRTTNTFLPLLLQSFATHTTGQTTIPTPFITDFDPNQEWAEDQADFVYYLFDFAVAQCVFQLSKKYQELNSRLLNCNLLVNSSFV